MAKKISIKGPIVTNIAGRIYRMFGWEAACPQDLAKELEEAAGEDVIVEINSNGGVATAGFEMYKTLMDYKGKVTAHVITAMSAASIVMCAADEVLASDAAIVMIHNTQCYAEGDYRDMQQEADSLIEFNQGIINVYVRKTGRSREELQALMDKDTYMSPAAAMEYGFVDDYLYGNPEKSEDEKGKTVFVNATVPVITEDKAKEILALLNGEEVVNLKDIGDIPDSDKNNEGKEGTKTMDLEQFLAENEEAKKDFDAKILAVREEGAANEGKRLEDLDKLAASIPEEALQEAKYGEKKVDAKELAFQVMQEGKVLAKSYMQKALKDEEESQVENVGAAPDEENQTDESDEMAAMINKKKGGNV